MSSPTQLHGTIELEHYERNLQTSRPTRPLSRRDDYESSFWAYEGSRKLIDTGDDAPSAVATKVLLCGGIAGCATWLSVYPLDVIKTRVQAQVARPLLAGCKDQRLTTLECTKKAIREGGLGIFFSGLGVCGLYMNGSRTGSDAQQIHSPLRILARK
ncbi:hypothetical protein RUND412_008289 [Rhizina undulata]